MTETRTDGGNNGKNGKPKLTLGKIVKGYAKWGLITDVILSVIMVVVQDTILNALANLAHYHGVGYYLAVAGTSILSFIINFFIGVVALIVIAAFIFVTLVLIAFFSDRAKQSSTEERPESEATGTSS